MQVEDRPATTGGTRWTARSSPRSAGGRPPRSRTGLAATVDWYRANEAWWRAARSGDWDGWYARQYGHRLATGQAAAITVDTAATGDTAIAVDPAPKPTD